MTTRDPRNDPQPGDVIRKGTAHRVIERHVLRVHENNVYYRTSNSQIEKCAWITTWRTWARDASVVNKS
jgi:hypothetical protein